MSNKSSSYDFFLIFFQTMLFSIFFDDSKFDPRSPLKNKKYNKIFFFITAPARVVSMNFFEFFWATFKKRNSTQKGPPKILKIKKKLFHNSPNKSTSYDFFLIFLKTFEKCKSWSILSKKGGSGGPKIPGQLFLRFWTQNEP